MAEPMGEKAITDLAGIGDVLGKRLESKGFDKVKKDKHASNLIVIISDFYFL